MVKVKKIRKKKPTSKDTKLQLKKALIWPEVDIWVQGREVEQGRSKAYSSICKLVYQKPLRTSRTK